MGNVIVGLSVSVDGFITGREPGPGKGLGDASVLHDWYWNGDTPSSFVDGFKLFEPSRRLFDDFVSRIAAVVAGRNSYEDAQGWGGAGPHPTAPLVVVSHRPPPPEATDAQTFVTSIEEGIETARALAGDGVVALMGGGVTTAALGVGSRGRRVPAPDPGAPGRRSSVLPGVARTHRVETGGGTAGAGRDAPALQGRQMTGSHCFEAL